MYAHPAQGLASPRTPDLRPSVDDPARVPAESQREERAGPVLRNFTTSEIWLVDAADSGFEEEDEEDEEEEETEFPSETRFLLRLGILLSLAGGRKGC